MSRHAIARIVLEGRVECVTALHVGGAEDDLIADLTVATDGLGRPHVPGTSLAGALREWTRRLQDDPDGEQPSGAAAERAAEIGETLDALLWGGQPSDRDPHVGRITCDDAVVTPPPSCAPTQLRDGVGIDRHLGAAAERIKYDRQVWPPGSQLDLRLVIEARDERELAAARDLAAALLAALDEADLDIGAATSRGLGQLRRDHDDPEALTGWEQRLDTKAGVLATLRGNTTAKLAVDGPGSDKQRKLSPSPDRVRVEVTWRPDGPVMVAAGQQGIDVDLLPLTTTDAKGHQRLVLPGSGVKGALRSHAERIVRTVAELPSAPATGSLGFLEQIDDPPLVASLFGGPTLHQAAQGEEAGPQHRRGAAALSVRDCHSTTTWQPANRQATGLPASEALAGSEKLAVSHHVAIDRWTGGPVDGALYNRLEPHDVEWEALQLQVDVARLKANCARVDEDWKAALGLLFLVLSDLEAGWIPLGFGSTRGMGSVAVDSVRWTLPAGDHREGAQPDLPLASLDKVKHAWSRWCDRTTGGATQP